MGNSAHGQYKALLFAGIGYSLIAIVGSGVMLAANSAQWSFPMKGLSLGILAGIAVVGVIFCNLLAFAAGGSPAVVVSIGAAGGPILNAAIAITLYPPAPGSLRWEFIFGIAAATIGGYMITVYRPGT
ncbi:hypothetical protein F4X33_21380 [Candidatus Poribacteria bacterium]|nr:hypothetical protein [Candidatus Poribacteria bacterium]